MNKTTTPRSLWLGLIWKGWLAAVLVAVALAAVPKSGNLTVTGTSAAPAFGPPEYYFADLVVTETVTRRKLTVSEVVEILDRQPNVKTVWLQVDPPRGFSINTLAYPQYAYRYTLTKAEWAELQAYCADQLKESTAVEEVRAHWVAIVQGTPPFGLRVAP